MLNFSNVLQYDFKLRSVAGSPGSGTYMGLMTLAPWLDATGGPAYQMNFNAGGLYHRQGGYGSGWGAWSKVIMGDGNGNLTLDGSSNALFTLKSNTTGNWKYFQFVFPEGRMAYIGITPDKDLYIGKENGGDIVFSGSNVGIGTLDPAYLLSVDGTIGARKVKVTQESWADAVFAPEYRLRSLYAVEQFIKERNHLPEVPSEAEVQQEGLDLGEMNRVLLQKVEELTLYLIAHRKELDKLKAELEKYKDSDN